MPRVTLNHHCRRQGCVGNAGETIEVSRRDWQYLKERGGATLVKDARSGPAPTEPEPERPVPSEETPESGDEAPEDPVAGNETGGDPESEKKPAPKKKKPAPKKKPQGRQTK